MVVWWGMFLYGSYGHGKYHGRVTVCRSYGLATRRLYGVLYGKRSGATSLYHTKFLSPRGALHRIFPHHSLFQRQVFQGVFSARGHVILLCFRVCVGPNVFRYVFYHVNVRVFGYAMRLPSIYPSRRQVIQRFHRGNRPPYLGAFVRLAAHLMRRFCRVSNLRVRLSVSKASL